MATRETALGSLVAMPADSCLLDLQYDAGPANHGDLDEKQRAEESAREPDGRISWEWTGEWPVVAQGLSLVEV
jgi:hypothetical protein